MLSLSVIIIFIICFVYRQRLDLVVVVVVVVVAYSVYSPQQVTLSEGSSPDLVRRAFIATRWLRYLLLLVRDLLNGRQRFSGQDPAAAR